MEAERLETSIDALALAAVLERPWVDVALSGAAREDHLASNLKALQVYFDEEAKHNLKELTETPEEYWSFRGGLPWN